VNRRSAKIGAPLTFVKRAVRRAARYIRSTRFVGWRSGREKLLQCPRRALTQGPCRIRDDDDRRRAARRAFRSDAAIST
jgi:hypothetical protein